MPNTSKWILLCTIVTGCLFGQHRVQPDHRHERILCVVPMVGAGTYADPRRPMFTPSPANRDIAQVERDRKREGLLGYSFEVSDDGTLAIGYPAWPGNSPVSSGGVFCQPDRWITNVGSPLSYFLIHTNDLPPIGPAYDYEIETEFMDWNGGGELIQYVRAANENLRANVGTFYAVVLSRAAGPVTNPYRFVCTSAGITF